MNKQLNLSEVVKRFSLIDQYLYIDNPKMHTTTHEVVFIWSRMWNITLKNKGIGS